MSLEAATRLEDVSPEVVETPTTPSGEGLDRAAPLRLNGQEEQVPALGKPRGREESAVTGGQNSTTVLLGDTTTVREDSKYKESACSTSEPEEDEGTIMLPITSLGFFCSCVPWFYGPYGQQTNLLASYFSELKLAQKNSTAEKSAKSQCNAKNEIKGKNGTSTTGTPAKQSTKDCTASPTSKATKHKLDKEKLTLHWFVHQREPLPLAETRKYPHIRFHRVGKAPWLYTSEMNEMFEKQGVQAFITLMDMNRVFVDEALKPLAISWFPNHWEKLDIHSRHSLSQFDVVVPLAPSDESLIQRQLPHKVVRHVPHVIRDVRSLSRYSLSRGGGKGKKKDKDQDARSTSRSSSPSPDAGAGIGKDKEGAASSLEYLEWRKVEKEAKVRAKRKRELRTKIGTIPTDAFVVLVLFGNYDKNNRKSVDVSLQVFKEFQEGRAPGSVFLYVHALATSGKSGAPSANEGDEEGAAAGVNMELLIDAVGLPLYSYHLNQRELKYEQILELHEMADVFLHPSKAEGFGLPVLEAQLLGNPVITTKFGAMMDYAAFGTSVEPNGRTFMELGLVAVPDFRGTLAALQVWHERLKKAEQDSVASKKELVRLAGERQRAQDYIASTMSLGAVGRKFAEILKTVQKASAARFSLHSYADPPPKPTAGSCQHLVFHSPAYVVDQSRIEWLLDEHILEKKKVNSTGTDQKVSSPSPSTTSDTSATSSNKKNKNKGGKDEGNKNGVGASSGVQNDTRSAPEVLWLGAHYELQGGTLPQFAFDGGGVAMASGGSKAVAARDNNRIDNRMAPIGAPVVGSLQPPKSERFSGVLPTVIVPQKLWQRIYRPPPADVGQIFQNPEIMALFRYAGVVGVRRPTQQWPQG
ncbi:unnamed protein product [Amoebophrya sp. A25]|nr:unnamed protein product [Amoebophrya sp. A25]|eukprot:GSA25T00004438001.1